MKKRIISILSVLLALLLSGCALINPPYEEEPYKTGITVGENGYFDYSEIPPFDEKTPYIALNGNKPFFDTSTLVTTSYEDYGKLDNLGRCTTVCSNIGKDLMPTDPRERISSVKPTGWHLVRYSCVEGYDLFNRCHLIGFQLTGENANERNLITGTRYMNVEGMLPFENLVADYVKETGNHVFYRVTPVFLGRELVARGVIMEGYSVEDDGKGVCFNVFCYNNQPQIEIDYATGDSRFVGNENGSETTAPDYVLNTSSKRFHLPGCPSIDDISEKNKKNYTGTREQLILDGYTPCGGCNP